MDCESLFTLIFIISFFFGIVAVSIIYSNAVFFSRLTTGVDAIQSQAALLCERSVNITEKLSNLNGIVAEHAVLTHTENAVIQTALQEFSLRLNTLDEFHKGLQQFIHAQYETNRDIINVLQAVDTRVEHHVALLQGCPPNDDELPLVEKPDLIDLATSLYQVRDIVEAFKNDLITQVRLSREDYEELMTAAESKGELLPQQLNDLRLALGTLQAQLADFRNKFDTFTAD